MGGFEPQGRWQAAAYLAAGSSSFADFLAAAAPELLPGTRQLEPSPAGAGGGATELPHGTTIVTAVYDGGVVMAGDRRATAGDLVAALTGQ